MIINCVHAIHRSLSDQGDRAHALNSGKCRANLRHHSIFVTFFSLLDITAAGRSPPSTSVRQMFNAGVHPTHMPNQPWPPWLSLMKKENRHHWSVLFLTCTQSNCLQRIVLEKKWAIHRSQKLWTNIQRRVGQSKLFHAESMGGQNKRSNGRTNYKGSLSFLKFPNGNGKQSWIILF